MTKLEFQIDDDVTSMYVDGYKVSSVNSFAMVEATEHLLNLETGILPPVVRWISNSKRYVLVERPPSIQNITFHAAKPADIPDGKALEHTFALPLPWTLYMIEFDNSYYPISINVYAMCGPLKHPTDVIGTLPISNHYESGALCMPPRDFNIELKSIADGISLAHRIAWMSGFNLDMDYNVKRCIRYKRPSGLFADLEGRATPLKLYRKWQKTSLSEVIIWNNWINPIGYSHGPSDPRVNIKTVNHLMQYMINLDNQKTILDPEFNLSMLLKEAFNAASLLS